MGCWTWLEAGAVGFDPAFGVSGTSCCYCPSASSPAFLIFSINVPAKATVQVCPVSYEKGAPDKSWLDVSTSVSAGGLKNVGNASPSLPSDGIEGYWSV